MADGAQIEGVDYTGGVDIGQLAAAGKVFACRYGGPGGDWKHITPAEAQALSAAGVAVVANAEGSADGLLGGWSTGVSWASLAEEHFARCGMPPDRPIYFSVDFDVQSGQWAAVASALRGAAEILGGVHRVGVYGGRRAIEWARRDGVAAWYWQTYGWSSGVWVPGNHIEQYLNGVALAGGDVDLDRALASDYGQWTTGDDGVSTEDIEKNTYNADAYEYKGWTRLDDTVTEIRTNEDNPKDLIDIPNMGGRLLKALVRLDDTVKGDPNPPHGLADIPNELAKAIKQLLARPPVVAAPLDPAVLKAVLLDPEVLAGIAVAVADEDHRRSAS